MKMGNAAFELAELRAEQERDAGVFRARAAIRGHGEAHCITCGDPIDVARRMALPSAKRCLDCQSRLERFRGRQA